MKKKILTALALIIAAAALVVVSVLGTMAYLTSSSAVTNAFTIGDVGIQMFETKVDTNGIPVSPTEKTDTNTYHLVPGKTYTKDPTIYVKANSEASFLFVKIRNQIESIEVNDGSEKTIEEQMLEKGWKEYANTTTGTIYYLTNGNDEIRYVGSSEQEIIKVFDTFSLRNNCQDVLHLYGGAKVTVTAFAIQKAPAFVDDADMTAPGAKSAIDKAWAAIVETYPYENGTVISE